MRGVKGPIRIMVTAPAKTGKTTIIRLIEKALEAEGISVQVDDPDCALRGPDDAVVIIVERQVRS